MPNGLSPEFIRQIPKTDLHVHLDGSLRIETLIELAKAEKVDLPSYEADGLMEQVFKETYQSLPEYLEGFRFTVPVLQRAEHLERVAYELALDNIEEGVRYVEVRFAPQLHTHKQLPIADVVRAVCRGMDRAKKEHNSRSDIIIPFEYGVIVCALRSFHPEMSEYYRDLFHILGYAPRKLVFATASLELARVAATLAHRDGLPVVGFDLAGEESGYPAEDHSEAFQHAHSNFIRKTVHAGEAYGPESIFQAITACHANRIGHGTFLFSTDQIHGEEIEDKAAYVRNLAEYIANQRITIEVNLTSNLQTTPAIKSISEHPLREMLDYNLSVSLCTDNRLHSRTTVSRELALAAEHLPITRRQFRNMIVAGFKGSFYPGRYNDKRAYVRKVIDRYAALERDLLGEESHAED